MKEAYASTMPKGERSSPENPPCVMLVLSSQTKTMLSDFRLGRSFQKHVAKFVLLTAPVGTGQIKSVRCIRTRREPTRRRRRAQPMDGSPEGLVAPPQHVAVSVQQHVGLERVAPAVVRQPQLGHARGQRRRRCS